MSNTAPRWRVSKNPDESVFVWEFRSSDCPASSVDDCVDGYGCGRCNATAYWGLSLAHANHEAHEAATRA